MVSRREVLAPTALVSGRRCRSLRLRRVRIHVCGVRVTIFGEIVTLRVAPVRSALTIGALLQASTP
jgi:hypothetical protein